MTGVATSPLPDGGMCADTREPRILSLSCLYPSVDQPAQGIFIQRRLEHLAQRTELRVISPSAIVQWSNLRGKRPRPRPAPPGKNGTIEVLRPPWFYPPLAGSTTPFWLFGQILPVIANLRKRFAFDILDTHFGHPDGIAGALLAKALDVPFTMTFRGNEIRWATRGPGRKSMSWAVRHASRVFTVSERLRAFAIDLGAAPSKVETIPNGVDAAVFFDRGPGFRERLGIPAHRKLILSAGALVERKGHHRVVEALQRLRAAGYDCELAIAGGAGPEERYDTVIRGLVEQYGLSPSVHFLGAIDAHTLAEAMSAADLFCLASSNEGWPNVVHEALACGCPVVATDVGAVPDMLDRGRYGCIVQVNDTAALERGLIEALGRQWDRDAIARWGQARSWSQVADEVLKNMRQIYHERAGGRR